MLRSLARQRCILLLQSLSQMQAQHDARTVRDLRVHFAVAKETSACNSALQGHAEILYSLAFWLCNAFAGSQACSLGSLGYLTARVQNRACCSHRLRLLPQTLLRHEHAADC